MNIEENTGSTTVPAPFPFRSTGAFGAFPPQQPQQAFGAFPQTPQQAFGAFPQQPQQAFGAFPPSSLSPAFPQTPQQPFGAFPQQPQQAFGAFPASSLPPAFPQQSQQAFGAFPSFGLGAFGGPSGPPVPTPVMPSDPRAGQILQVGRTQIKIIRSIGAGVYKKASLVEVLNGPYQGKQVVLLEPLYDFSLGEQWSPSDTARGYEIAKDTGYVPHVVDFSEKPPKLLITSAKGRDLCDMIPETNGLLTPRQQLIIFNAFIQLAKRGLTQGDPNCGNFLFDGENLTIIDDLSNNLSPNMLLRIYNVMYNMMVLQWNRHRDTFDKLPGWNYARQFYLEYGKPRSNSSFQEFNPSKSFTPLVPENPEFQDFYNQANAIIASALTHGGKQRKLYKHKVNKSRKHRKTTKKTIRRSDK